MEKTRKKGLFLSIETVGVLIIITAIAAVIVAGIAHLFKMYKVYQISRDISQYSEAVLQFKVSYRFLPGDVPPNKLNANLNNQYLTTDVNLFNSPAPAVSPFPRGYITPEAGSLVAFRQLSLAGLISAPINTTNTPIFVPTATCTALKDLVFNRFIPTASWDDSLAWTLGSEKDRAPKGSVMSHEDLSAIWTTARIRLILFRPAKLTGTGTDKCVVDLASGANEVGALSPVVAAELANKLSDGSPSSQSSRIIAENNKPATATETSCTDLTTVTGSPAGTIISAKFNNNTNDSGANGCLISAGIDGAS